MIKLEFNGKPFDPQNFTETILKSAMEAVASEMHDKVSSIRHPVTGEFPTVVVSGTSLDDITMKIEGSPELLELVNVRLGTTNVNATAPEIQPAQLIAPKVFLSYTSEDKSLASKIAHALQANGIDTWWDEWCITAGDSLRQKIDEGLGNCTHFVVLLTPGSLNKPWVNQEMDSALVLKLKSQVAKFISLRHELSVDQLPPLLQGMHSPSIEDFEQDIHQLVNDIHGITKKPALGPVVLADRTGQGFSSTYSAAANAVAKVFILKTNHARKFDPFLELDEIMKETGLPKDDVEDAIHELKGMVVEHYGSFYPEDELFVEFDRYWMAWNPKDDALKLATDMVNADDFPKEPEAIAVKYGWSSRRINPAMAYLHNRKLVKGLQCLGGGDCLLIIIERNADTRRFVKSRA
jgi:hypothetical protein